jgi:hypothetical protein
VNLCAHHFHQSKDVDATLNEIPGANCFLKSITQKGQLVQIYLSLVHSDLSWTEYRVMQISLQPSSNSNEAWFVHGKDGKSMHRFFIFYLDSVHIYTHIYICIL